MAPYSLDFDTLIQAKVEAFNRNGWSDESLPNEASLLKDKIQTVPTTITSLAEGLLTNTQQIHLVWSELTTYIETGGADITSYNIQWDAGQYGLIWQHLVGYEADMLGTEYTVTQSILPSFEYSFQIRAQNKWGWSEWSEVITVKASTWPEIISEPTTAISLDDGNVVVSWVQPDERGSPIY